MTLAPPRRAPRAALAAAVAAVMLGAALAGCSSATTGSTSTPAATGGSPAAAVVSSPLVGVPIDIEAEGFSDVRAFTVRTDAGQQVRFVMGVLENGAAFPPNHLAEHLAASTRVRVFFRDQGGERVAYRLEDAETP